MKTTFYTAIGYSKVICLFIVLQFSLYAFGQTASSKSLLINHGSTCGSDAPQQQFFGGSTSANPVLVNSGNVGLAYYSMLVAYNPEDHKVYYADVKGSTANIYVVDYNLAGTIANPVVAAPTYSYKYPLNQLCFDNNGDNYVFYNFQKSTGTVNLNRIDIMTGDEIPGTNKTVTFPSTDIPNTLSDGDIIVLPNGRMFVTFGNSPSKLYEILNSDGAGNAKAVLLANIPRVCFSIAFVDGNLIVAGSDNSGCYYYVWDINSFSLSGVKSFPAGKNSADMTNMTLAIGTSNKLMGLKPVNSKTANVYYEITLKNKGNIFLSNAQLTNNLTTTFGKGNISNIKVSFASNPANLLLNPNYDGVNDTNLLKPGQILNNFPDKKDSIVIRLQLTATNLIPGQVYNNSAIGYGQIGAGTNFMSVTDSSNNGDWTKIDIDNNGVSSDTNENKPTPLAYGNLLPLSQLELKGTKNQNIIQLKWESSIDEVVTAYDVQRSLDGKQFYSIAVVTPTKKSLYSFDDNVNQLQQSLFYYRIKAVKSNENSLYSNLLLIKNSAAASTVSLSPNPFQSTIHIQAYSPVKTKAELSLLDVTGRVVLHHSYVMEPGNSFFTLPEAEKVRPGIYWLKWNTGSEQKIIKVIKQ